MASTQKGATFPAERSIQKGILDFIEEALGKGAFDAVLIPSKVPGGDSIAYLLIQDKALLKDAYPLPPVMSVQGANAVADLTGHGKGKGKKRIAVVMRPCEVRATAELFKLGQVNLDKVILISIDCPGVFPMAEWVKHPKKVESDFWELCQQGSHEGVRPLCQICDMFSANGAEDLHIGVLEVKKGSILLIPHTAKGKRVLSKLGLSADVDISAWKDMVGKLTRERKTKRAKAQKELASSVKGVDNILDALNNCINCHNCMRVCPICYCRQCFFDSDKLRFPIDDYLARAEIAGGLRLPPETLLFHLGRMLHMSLSCVSCGQCEDACPTSVPVSQLFSLVGDKNQKAFKYVSGRSLGEELPLRTYEEKELEEVEQSYSGTLAKEEARDA